MRLSVRGTLFVVACALAPLVARAQQEGARRDEGQAEPAPEPQLTRPPELIQGVAPEYPPGELAAGRTAEVLVRIHVDAAGKVTEATVVEGVNDAFDQAALAAARQYVFRPAEWDGVPGPITVETTIHFVIDTVEPEAPADPSAQSAIDLAYEPGPPERAGDPRKPVTIQGEALQRGTRDPIAGVVVSIVELGLDAVTDSAGRFYFHGAAPGTYTVVASERSYDRFTRRLILAKGERAEIRLHLRRKGGNPYETLVEGDKEAFEITRRTLDRRQMTTVPGTFGDPIRVVQSLPGLARTPFVSGFLLIRGSFPGDSGIYVDGHQVPLLFHFLGGPSFLNPEFLSELNLYPGGFPARFGRAQGGIVAVETRAAETKGVHGSADIDLLDAGGYLRAPVGKHGRLAVAGRRSYLNLLLPFFLPEPDEGDTLIVTPVYQDYNVRYDHALGRHGDLSIFLFGSNDRLDVLSANAAAEQSFNLDSSIGFFRLITSYKRPLVGGLRLTMSTAWGRDSVKFAGAQFQDDAPQTELDVTQAALSYRLRIDGRLSDDLRLDTGLDIASRITQYKLFVPTDDNVRVIGNADIPSEALSRTIDGLNMGVYTELTWDVSSRVRLIPGLRIDNYVLANQHRASIDPRLVARWNFAADWTAKGYLGLFNQPPQPESFDARFGNPNLGLEGAVHTGLGAEWKLARYWSADIEGYYIGRYDQSRFTDDAAVLDDGTVRPLRLTNSGSGYTAGLEALIRRELTENQYGWLSYTLSYSKARRDDDDDFDFTGFDQRHNLNAVYSYRTGSGWELGARYRLATGVPDTPIVDSTFDVDADRYVPVRGEYRSIRRKTFHQLDVRAEKNWLFNTWSLGIYLDVLNVLNLENVEATQYDYRFRDSAPVTGVPLVPTLGVKGQF
jgi:TonB family protein